MSTKLLSEVEKIVIEKGGRLEVSYDEGGSGMALHWCVNSAGWPYCSGSTLEQAFTVFVSEHKRLKREQLQKQINEIDASASL